MSRMGRGWVKPWWLVLGSLVLAPLLLAGCGKSDEAAVMPVAEAPVVAETVRPKRAYTIEEFIGSTSVTGAFFSNDESKMLFSSNKSGVWNANLIPVGRGVWASLSTSTTDNTYAAGHFPADGRILLTRDQGGNELAHLYVIGTDG